ncbi:hypothetical protein [Algoriphagus confluentis]|uniref:SH3 domain-containing protein n=1 Tax=Algoriphagus confluentis TaxID=1697556 RepID=A0ABQ6PTP4_9BACT|nr:hypothetical protein Aconfl_32680 [Algoriphagus confluentis]
MKNSLILINVFFLLVNSCASLGGQNEKIGDAFILGFDKVKFFDKVDGCEIGQIQNNELEEIYYSLEVYDQKNDWFKVQAIAMKETITVWILNKSYLATYSRNYSDTLSVYKEPNKRELICSVTDYFTSPMLVIEFKKDLVKVKINDSIISCSGGWVAQNMTCSSPYTTCN